MRISTSQIYQQSLNAMLDQQTQLNHTQQQLSTGRRVLTPADDPAAAARSLGLQQAIEATQQHQSNADVVQARLGLEDNVLSSVTNLLHRVRELAVQANNATQNNETRAAIAQEVRQRLDELLNLANTRDANGEYMFSGFQGRTQPFARNGAGGFTYSGDQGTRFVQVGPSTQVAMGHSGTEVFQAVRNGNGTFVTNNNPANSGSGVIDGGSVNGSFVADTYTLSFAQAMPSAPITYTVTGVVSGVVASGNYTSGNGISFNGALVRVDGTPANGDSFTVAPSTNQDIFTTLQNLAVALETPVIGQSGLSDLHNKVGRNLADMDQSLGNILEVRAQVGARLNTVDNQKDANEVFKVQLKEVLSSVQDLDYAEAASRLNQQLLSLQAAQQAFARVQGLSLFNFLR